MKFSSPGLVFNCSEALGAVLSISEQGCTYSFRSKHPGSIGTVIHLVFWFLASYRLGFGNGVTVSRTQTGLSRKIFLGFLSTLRLDSAFSSTW